VNNPPDIRRVRHELKRRQLTVVRVERFGCTMVRIVAGGTDIEGFTSMGFDDHIKLFFPSGVADPSPAMRDFTPRRYDSAAGELWIDFFLHDAGPASTWAAQAAVGQTINVGGPKGSSIISAEGIGSHLLIGDETGLPAIGRRLDELPAGSRVLVVIESDGGAQGYPLETKTDAEFVWVTRKQTPGAPAQSLIEEFRTLKFAHERCFAWAALESQSARAIRRYLVDERQIDKHWIKAAGYWQRDAVGVHDVIRDE
jgi:NADPH-dependent ferric siderophore reductase